MLPIQTILHPTDFSPRSDYAFRLACSLARDHGARLIILHVRPIPAHEFGHVSFDAKAGRIAQQQLARMLRTAAGLEVEHLSRFDNAADAIIRVAEEKQCDLTVMGTHGRTGLTRLLMGSVAEEVVRKAPCPVLTVKMPRQFGDAINTGRSTPTQIGAGI